MSIQSVIDKDIDELATKVVNSSKKVADDLEKEVNAISSKISALLLEYANNDGTISKSRLRKMLRELDKIEDDLYFDMTEEVDEGINDIIDVSEKGLNKILLASIGATLLYEGLIRPGKKGIKDDIRKFLDENSFKGVDLSDSLRASAGYMRDEIQKAIRLGVNRNESVKEIARRAKKSVEGSIWTFQRVVATELPLAFRKAIVTVGAKTGAIKAIRIIDHRGRHRNHENHMCYIYAEQDPYGWGKGVFRLTDTHILNPHPQCTAYYRYIIKDDIIKRIDEDAE